MAVEDGIAVAELAALVVVDEAATKTEVDAGLLDAAAADDVDGV